MIPRVTAMLSRPADNTAYTAGDAIQSSGTGSACGPIVFELPYQPSGVLTGCRCVVTPATGNLVITALDFDLMLFRPEADIPFAAGSYAADNAALAVSAAAMRELVAIFRFSNAAWRNPAGGLTAGVTGYQAVSPLSGRIYAPFNVGALKLAQPPYRLLGLLQAQAAWTPTGVVNQLDFALDTDLDQP